VTGHPAGERGPALSTIAYETIRDSIVHGRYAMGEQLVETRVAKQLGISRAPVREAFRRLAEERLVVERPRHGTFVRAFTAGDFADIYDLRIAVESAAIRLAVRRRPDLTPIEAAIAAMNAAALRGDVEEVVDLELGLHQQLCDASGNRYLASLFRSLAAPVRIALGLDDAAYADLHDVVREYEPLLAAIKAGEEDEAARALALLIVGSVAPALDRLGGDAPPGFLPGD
jgi:DNA-binding GntR family transcriptional regulator